MSRRSDRMMLTGIYAELLFSLRALVSTFLYLGLIPAANTALSRTGKRTAGARDLTLSRWSVCLLSVGSFIIAFARSTWVLAVGFTITVLVSGSSITLRSFLTASVDPAFSARFFAAISTIGTLGALVGTPIMGTVYSWGIKHELWNIAPPFAVAEVCQTRSTARKR
jgi:hypothetical protein